VSEVGAANLPKAKGESSKAAEEEEAPPIAKGPSARSKRAKTRDEKAEE